MASSDKKRKTKQNWKQGKGWARAACAKRNLMRATMKIKRFDRYQAEIGLGKRVAPLIKHGKRKGQIDSARFTTDGLKKYCEVQKEIIKMGRLTY